MRVLSFTRDAEERGRFRGFDCCWARPRMWEQYANDHRGVCLLFDPAGLKRAIAEHWPSDSTGGGSWNSCRMLLALTRLLVPGSLARNAGAA
jgi:hypothetical protein